MQFQMATIPEVQHHLGILLFVHTHISIRIAGNLAVHTERLEKKSICVNRYTVANIDVQLHTVLQSQSFQSRKNSSAGFSGSVRWNYNI